jgi:hypothetical protein
MQHQRFAYSPIPYLNTIDYIASEICNKSDFSEMPSLVSDGISGRLNPDVFEKPKSEKTIFSTCIYFIAFFECNSTDNFQVVFCEFCWRFSVSCGKPF